MKAENEIKALILGLHSKLSSLPNRDSETEKKAEEYLSQLFGALGWDWLSAEVMPQKQVKSGGKTKRVDYSFKKTGRIKPDFYMEVKKFSEDLNLPAHREQALSYGKNSGIRWVLLTNFTHWRVFNSDYFDEPNNAELFEFDLLGAASDPDKMKWLMLFSYEQGGPALDEYAKKHKKWKESESVEDLLTEQLIATRRALSTAIREQNHDLFDPEPTDEDIMVDSCVQHILDRLIFCRMLEDNGSDSGYRMDEERRRWESDKRVQFYGEFLTVFWEKMRKRYDSTIFDNHRIDGLTIKNEDFMPVFDSFYVNPKTKLRYRFEAIGTDILGHTYENYLSYKPKQTAKRTGLEKEIYKRKQSGIYYTPEFLVDHLVRATLGKKLEGCKSQQEALKLRVLDPACGSGTFLVRAFDEFRRWYLVREKKNGNGGHDEEVQGLSQFLDAVLENCIYGIDLDARAVRLAKLNLFLRAIDTPSRLPRLKIIQKNSLLNDGGFKNSFEIARDFPLVAEAGGFDVIIGNPPWERFEIKTQEFFEKYDEGFKDLGTKQAKKRAEELLARAHIKQDYQIKQAEYTALASHFQSAYEFQVDGARKNMSGHTDLYKLFTERAYQLAKDGGLVGLVVPSGIYTDLGTKSLRRMLFEHCQLKEMFGFENRKFIFQDIDQRYKFVLLTFQKGGTTSSFPCAFFLYGEEDLKRAVENPTRLTIDFIRSSSPISMSVVEIKSAKDFEIVNKLLAFSKLGEPAWGIKPFQGFNMTTDSHLFQTGKLGVPLLEGKNIHQFTHHWREAPDTRFTVSEKSIQKNLKDEKQYQNGYWIGYRLIARSTDHRTLIATVVPPGYVCGHSMAVIMLSDLKKISYLAGIMNSFVLDYVIRQKMSANINFNFFLELPVPTPEQAGAYYDQIAKKAAQLVATTDEFEQLKKEVGISHGIVEENDRLLARAQLDVAVAKLYGITKDELAYILEKFPIFDPKQKELVLREY
ncbi:MAG: N-6 DNA methylase [Candidatus Micrarchaeota archaeon]|nr:N-6 DNA methylase [Candidatus Micrarchaeota archaeon]